jgi:hypothetical protein
MYGTISPLEASGRFFAAKIPDKIASTQFVTNYAGGLWGLRSTVRQQCALNGEAPILDPFLGTRQFSVARAAQFAAPFDSSIRAGNVPFSDASITRADDSPTDRFSLLTSKSHFFHFI